MHYAYLCPLTAMIFLAARPALDSFGIALAHRLTAVWPKVMVILLTGDNTNSIEGCLIQAFFMITLKISRNARKKAFETCAPHLIVFINFSFVSIFFVIYFRFYPNFQHLFLSVSYNLFPPLLHPLVYGIRNKETRQSFSKVRRKVIFALSGCQTTSNL
ncbi:olfactory receptor 52A5-like [Sardina pilchardus]|uniref:olfactory receptor 52A5-like n=1 Tax=Sardina pilchardus TaxID=27697 RepID=UPI002E0E0C4E